MHRLTTIALALAALLALPAGSSAQEAACTKTWSGPATGNWNTAANWTQASVPGPADVVCLGAGTDTTNNSARSVLAVRSDGIVRATSALTLTGPEPSRIEDLHTSTGIAGAGNLEVDALTWTGGTMSGTGTTTVRETHTISSGTVGNGRSIVTEGTGSWTGSISGSGTATWTNRADITFGPGDLNATVVTGERPRFLNEATGSLLRTSNGGNYNIAWQLENDGAIGRTTDPAVGDIYVDYGATGASSGTFDGANISASPFQLAEGAALSRASIGGDVVLGGGTLVATDLQIAGGSLTGPGTVLLQGHFHAYYGVLGTPDTLVILPADQTMEWTHAFGMRARRFESAGEVTVTETGLGRPENTWGTRTVWENTGTVHILSGLFPTFPGDEGARFVNRGLLVKETTSTFTFRPWLINDGVIEVLGGRLVATQYEHTTDGTTRFDIHGAAVSTGYGQVQAATLRYAGRLEAILTGGYVPAASARHDVFSVGTAARSGVFGSTSLAGLVLDEAGTTTIGLVQPATPLTELAAADAPSGVAALVASPGEAGLVAPPSVAGPASAVPTAVRSFAQRSAVQRPAAVSRVSQACRAARKARSKATSRRARRAAAKRVARACRAASAKKSARAG